MFIFPRKQDPVEHKPQYCTRKDTISGTHDLQMKKVICDIRFLAEKGGSLLQNPARDFSLARFRATLASSVCRHRQFKVGQDKLYALMINELRPGTRIPDRTTIIRDVQQIYEMNAAPVCT
jgi:hypothetical protein